MMEEPLAMQSDARLYRVVVEYENAKGPMRYGPPESLADAKARFDEEEQHLCKMVWIENIKGVPLWVIEATPEGLSPVEREIFQEVWTANLSLSVEEVLRQLRAAGV
jgi:hypothetical protein